MRLVPAGTVEEADENPCDVLTTQSGKGKYSDTWLLDSGCTLHMCPKESGSVQTNLLMQAVLMGNDTVCKTITIGNICMRMFDEHVRTLTSIRHVPDLRKNLLLLRALEVQQCKFLGADGGIKVTKDSMMILKGERMVNLYKMIRSVIIGNASVTTEKDTTRLWHMRLGYMSERDIQALHNKGALPYIKYCELSLCKFCI